MRRHVSPLRVSHENSFIKTLPLTNVRNSFMKSLVNESHSPTNVHIHPPICAFTHSCAVSPTMCVFTHKCAHSPTHVRIHPVSAHSPSIARNSFMKSLLNESHSPTTVRIHQLMCRFTPSARIHSLFCATFPRNLL